MALICEAGQFPAPSSNIEQTVTLNNFTGVTPKAVLLFYTGHAANDAPAGTAVIGLGGAANNQASIMLSSLDAGANSSAFRTQTDVHVLRRISTATFTENNQASFNSFGVNQFTITWNGAVAPAGQLINYLALGGSDLTNAALLSFANPVTTGNQGFTGVGFQPDAVIIFTSALANTGEQDSVHILNGLGVFTNSSQASYSIREVNNVTTSEVQQAQLTTKCLQQVNGDAAYLYSASFVSMDADGFTLNYDTVDAGARRFFALCLKGGQYHVGAGLQKTSTGAQAYTGTGFTPTGLFFFNAGGVASASIIQDGHLNIGATSGATQNVSAASMIEDNQDTTDTDRALTNSKCIQSYDHTQTLLASADLDSFDANGFTLDWTTADATERQFIYLAMGSEGEGGGGDSLPLLLAHYEG